MDRKKAGRGFTIEAWVNHHKRIVQIAERNVEQRKEGNTIKITDLLKKRTNNTEQGKNMANFTDSRREEGAVERLNTEDISWLTLIQNTKIGKQVQMKRTNRLGEEKDTGNGYGSTSTGDTTEKGKNKQSHGNSNKNKLTERNDKMEVEKTVTEDLNIGQMETEKEYTKEDEQNHIKATQEIVWLSDTEEGTGNGWNDTDDDSEMEWVSNEGESNTKYDKLRNPHSAVAIKKEAVDKITDNMIPEEGKDMIKETGKKSKSLPKEEKQGGRKQESPGHNDVNI